MSQVPGFTAPPSPKGGGVGGHAKGPREGQNQAKPLKPSKIKSNPTLEAINLSKVGCLRLARCISREPSLHTELMCTGAAAGRCRAK